MVSAVTVGERIILHLAQYSKYIDSFDAPPEVSQDGIAEAIRISRAHAAIELKKLKEHGDVFEKMSHIKKGPTKRKVYYLTEAGEKRAKNLKDYIQGQGIEIAPLLDLKKCKGPELWESTAEEFRPVLGMASVYRKKFRRCWLPETTISLFPEDKIGRVELPEQLRKAIQAMLDADALREYHSAAADHWLEEGDYRERLYHLLRSGRIKEAEMLVASRSTILLENKDPDLLSLLMEVPTSSERYGPKVLRARGETARAVGDRKAAMAISEQMTSSDDIDLKVEGLRLRAKVLMDSGEAALAIPVMTDALQLFGGRVDVQLECLMAEAESIVGRQKEARARLDGLMHHEAVRQDPDAIEMIYYMTGNLLLRQGSPSEAVKYLSKALGMARPGDKRLIHETMFKAYEALGMKDKAKEHASKAGIRISGST
ncbi:MAG: hypothetical protein HPY73_06950 [Methanomassiliicoccales archaeon]|nr:MAG: hypothetical protein HPY73_06950 [Methanomassiliicoccales archaeon]